MKIHDVATEDLGAVLAQLVKQGLTFDVYEKVSGVWTVELTGGY